jgi:hypothetical protein
MFGKNGPDLPNIGKIARILPNIGKTVAGCQLTVAG